MRESYKFSDFIGDSKGCKKITIKFGKIAGDVEKNGQNNGKIKAFNYHVYYLQSHCLSECTITDVR